MTKQGVKRESGGEARSVARRAFSRWDLLAVVCTVSILAALTSVVGSPNSSSNKLVCMENVRRICQATIMYAGDNEDYLPYPGWGDQGWGSRVCWLYKYYPRQKPVGIGFGRATRYVVQEGSLWPYLARNNVYICPSENTNSVNFRARTMNESSYVMNGAASGYSSGVDGAGGATYKLSQFAPDAIPFWEADEDLPFFSNDGSNSPDESFSRRHGAAMIGTFGGTVELMSVEEFERLAGPFANRGEGVRPGRLWCNPGSETGDTR